MVKKPKKIKKILKRNFNFLIIEEVVKMNMIYLIYLNISKNPVKLINSKKKNNQMNFLKKVIKTKKSKLKIIIKYKLIINYFIQLKNLTTNISIILIKNITKIFPINNKVN